MKRLLSLSKEELAFSRLVAEYSKKEGTHNPLQKVLVNGSPKTGTTWMLKLISSIPGYREVGNFDGEIQRYNSVQAGEVVHGHDWYTPELAELLLKNQIRVVLLMRDPRDQLISRVFHIRRVENHPWHDRLAEASLDEAILLCIEGRDGLPGTRTMIELTQSWLLGGFDMVVVRYEDLLHSPQDQFQRVLDYLQVKLPDQLKEAIIARNQFERLSGGRKFWKEARKQGQEDPHSHFRKGIIGDWKNYLKPEHIVRFKQVAGDKLIELGYEEDLDW